MLSLVNIVLFTTICGLVDWLVGEIEDKFHLNPAEAGFWPNLGNPNNINVSFLCALSLA